MPTGQVAVSAAGTAGTPALICYVPPGPCAATFSVTSGTAFLGSNVASNVGGTANANISLATTGIPVTSTAPYMITHMTMSPQLPVYGMVASGTVTVTYSVTSLLSG
jgi:hypothetical protein